MSTMIKFISLSLITVVLYCSMGSNNLDIYAISESGESVDYGDDGDSNTGSAMIILRRIR